MKAKQDNNVKEDRNLSRDWRTTIRWKNRRTTRSSGKN
jgi:hypothetical protein